MQLFQAFTPLLLKWLIVIFGFSLQSCNSDQSGDSNANGESFEDHHTSQMSLDYQGVYIGILPCEDCEGIETTVALGAENKFLKRERFIGKAEIRSQETTGNYYWHASGQVVTLEGVETGHSFFVGENYISQVDADGKRRTGAEEDRYRLNKEM